MSTLANQFMQGANFIRQNEQDAFRRDIITDENQRAAERHATNQQGASLRQQISADQHQEWTANADKRATLAELQMEQARAEAEDRTARRERQKVVDDQNDKIFARREKGWKQQDDAAARQENLQWLTENSEKELFNLKRHGYVSPEYFKRSQGTAFDLRNLNDPAYNQQLDWMAVALNPEDGRATPSDPKFLQAFNTVFKDDINKNLAQSQHPKTGSPAVKKEVIGAYPVEGQPGEFYLELAVTYEDGSVEKAPMTKGRDSNGEAELSTVGVGDLVQQVNVRQAYRNTMVNAGYRENQQAFQAHRAEQQHNADRPKFEGTTVWGGQEIKTSEVADQYAALPEVWREGDPDTGAPPYVTFDQYLSTQGNPHKLNVLTRVAQKNMAIDKHNSETNNPNEKLQRVDFFEAWAALQKESEEQAKPDPYESTLEQITNEDSGRPWNDPQEAHGSDEHKQRVSPGMKSAVDQWASKAYPKREDNTLYNWFNK